MSAVPKPGHRPYTRDFQPMAKEELDADLVPLDSNGWTVGRNFAVERRASAPVDRTGDAGDRAHEALCDEIRTRHMRELNAIELGDIACDDRLVAAVRGGNAAVIGLMLLALVGERVESVVRSAA